MPAGGVQLGTMGRSPHVRAITIPLRPCKKRQATAGLALGILYVTAKHSGRSRYKLSELLVHWRTAKQRLCVPARANLRALCRASLQNPSSSRSRGTALNAILRFDQSRRHEHYRNFTQSSGFVYKGGNKGLRSCFTTPAAHFADQRQLRPQLRPRLSHASHMNQNIRQCWTCRAGAAHNVGAAKT